MISFESLIEEAKRRRGCIMPADICSHKELLEARDNDLVAYDEKLDKCFVLIMPVQHFSEEKNEVHVPCVQPSAFADLWDCLVSLLRTSISVSGPATHQTR